MPTFRDVDPGDLRLPPGRQDGAVASRYHQQVAKYGGNTNGMPPVEVTEGRDGELMINNGVTRATRLHSLAPGKLITVEITELRPKANFAKLLRVRDVPPPP
jgi:hypothetical protein